MGVGKTLERTGSTGQVQHQLDTQKRDSGWEVINATDKEGHEDNPCPAEHIQGHTVIYRE